MTKERVSFDNQYRMEIVGNLFRPKSWRGRRLSAIVVGHPIGAVKEQSSNLYATKLAEQGFAALAIDQSFWGESEGELRQSVLPDVYTKAFMASVDFFGTRGFVDRDRIGILGICGSGSMVISAAKLDPRMKAVATVSMYDMGAVNRNGLNHAQSLKQRKKILADAAQQRYTEFLGGETRGPAAPRTRSTRTPRRLTRSSMTSTAPRAASSPRRAPPRSRRRIGSCRRRRSS